MDTEKLEDTLCKSLPASFDAKVRHKFRALVNDELLQVYTHTSQELGQVANSSDVDESANTLFNKLRDNLNYFLETEFYGLNLDTIKVL